MHLKSGYPSVTEVNSLLTDTTAIDLLQFPYYKRISFHSLKANNCSFHIHTNLCFLFCTVVDFFPNNHLLIPMCCHVCAVMLLLVHVASKSIRLFFCTTAADVADAACHGKMN